MTYLPVTSNYRKKVTLSLNNLTVMSKQGSVTLVIASLGMCVVMTMFGCQSPQSKIIRQVDHVLITSSESEELFSLFSDTFQMPVVWPMDNYGRFTSGGVAVGNVNIEIVVIPAPNDGIARSRFVGLAFEPEPLSSSLAALDKRDITHGPAVPFISLRSDGSIGTLWTTVMLPNMSENEMMVFLCEYAHDVETQRRQSLDQLRSRDGGPLTIDSVREIVIVTSDLDGSRDTWQRLLDPLSATSQGVWQIQAGPNIRVVQGDDDRIQELVINVRSLAQARRFLKEEGMIGASGRDELTMAGPYLQGLNIKLVERD